MVKKTDARGQAKKSKILEAANAHATFSFSNLTLKKKTKLKICMYRSPTVCAHGKSRVNMLSVNNFWLKRAPPLFSDQSGGTVALAPRSTPQAPSAGTGKPFLNPSLRSSQSGILLKSPQCLLFRVCQYHRTYVLCVDGKLQNADLFLFLLHCLKVLHFGDPPGSGSSHRRVVRLE